jgi:hypothetical protein
MAIFLKTYGEDMLRSPYEDYISLNRWQDNRDLFSMIYFSVTTHRRKGKNVSILPSGNVNLGPSPQDKVCLRTVPIMW